MDRWIGIDYGRRRTGLAASDPLRIFATALDTVDSTKIIDYLKNYAQKETIGRFVVGYPVNLDGRPAEAQKDVDAFLKVLAKAFPEEFAFLLHFRVQATSAKPKSLHNTSP